MAVGIGEPRVQGEIIEAEQVEEPEAGRRQAQKMQSPVRPRAEEVAEHELSHLPYRSWCRFCVRGRCRALPHRAGVEQPMGNELHFDYCFLGKEGEPGKTLPVIAVKERISGMLMGAVVPAKTSGTYVANRVTAFMKEVGCELGDIVVKYVQEPAILSVISDVGRQRAAGGRGKFVVERSPVGPSQSNGVIERGAQSIAGQTRVRLNALEDTWRVQLPYDHA